MNKLLDAYSGEGASGYDARRSKSGRWRRETSAMRDFLSRISPGTVLDCPFGTGRWVELFGQNCKTVFGVDLSADMLKEASAVVEAFRHQSASDFDLRVGSIFDLDPADFEPAPDLVSCIRFVNWVDFKDTERAIARLSAFGSKHFILGASVVPQGASALSTFVRRLALGMVNRKSADGRLQYVHDEADLLACLTAHGWALREKRLVFKKASRVNYFYLLERAS